MKLRVSVVIPAYNAENWISDTIQSVFIQSYPEIELIIIDDCSTDNTWNTIQELKKTIPENIKSFITYKNEVNSKECKTSRKGFSLATGYYICRLSADDLFISAKHLEHQVAVLEQTKADWCYNNIYTTGDNPSGAQVVRTTWFPAPQAFHLYFLQYFDNYFLSHPYFTFLLLLIRNPVNSSTFMIRADSYRKYAQWSDVHWTDCDSVLLMNLLLFRSHGVAIQESSAFYRLHPGQGSQNPAYRKEVIRIRREIIKSVLEGDYPFWLKAASRIIARIKYAPRNST